MGTLDIDKAETSDMTNVIEDVTISPESTDGIGDTKETPYSNSEWSKWYAYFNNVPDLHSALLMKSTWNVGKGYITGDKLTQVILDKIKGNNKENFKTILFNMDLVRNINGDSYAEIIRNKKGTLVNLKPLDPSSITIIYNGQGLIERYEQTSKLGFIKRTSNKVLGTNFGVREIKTGEMFHLSVNRVADNLGGTSRIKAIEKTILASNESFEDISKLMHRQVKPFLIFKWKTDDENKIREMKSRIDNLRKLGEDLHLPADDDVLTIQEVKINLSDIVFTWRNDLKNAFYRFLGLPLVVFGAGGSTESGGKMEMFAHETLFESDQQYLETEVWNQLALRINLIPPNSLSQNLQTDEAKDRSANGLQQGLELQKNDVTIGSGA